MTEKNAFVHSNYGRKKDDDYQTIDIRCVGALLSVLGSEITGLCVDPCAPTGSGIVDGLKRYNVNAIGLPDAFADGIESQWIITNPPYKRPLVDNVIHRQIGRLKDGEVTGAAFLLRSTFDHAKTRVSMFSGNEHYRGQIKLLFRPWWVADRSKQPIHNFSWYVFGAETYPIKQVWYSGRTGNY